MSTPRVRIAPSPTGYLHVGTARAALFNYLFAKKHGGVFVLRIEDTDVERSDKKYEQNIFEGLRWLGIDPDEGPEQSGPYGPYRQTERTATYEKYIRQLLAEGKAFYCFHSEKELAEEKDRMMAEKRAVLHVCEYRDIPPADAEALAGEKSDCIIRFKTPAGRNIEFTDLIRGEVVFESDLLGDFSIAKRPEIPLYNFAVVIDDYEMKITHIIRGEDHIANTPKQMLIAWALGWTQKSEDGRGNMQPPWKYAHLPLILDPDRSKLSKRHGATSVDEYRAQGYLPEALFNFMAFIGWNPGDNREIFSKEELIQEFSLEKVQRSGAIFDFQKLDWMNGEYIRKKSVAELTDLCPPFFGADTSEKSREYLEKIIALEQPRLKKLSEIGERTDYFFCQPEYDKELLRWKEMTDEELAKSLKVAAAVLGEIPTEKFIAEELKERIYKDKKGILDDQRIREVIATKIYKDGMADFDFGRILWPLRVALAGKKASPGPFEIMEVLGIEESLARIRAAQKKFE